MDYWSNFARTGDPNKGSRVQKLTWPEWEPTKKISMVLQTPNTLATGLSAVDCDLWDSLGICFPSSFIFGASLDFLTDFKATDLATTLLFPQENEIRQKMIEHLKAKFLIKSIKL